MIGSFLTGQTSLLTGTGSALTAAGVCAPFPGLFLTDGASFDTGDESVLTAAQPPACSTGGCNVLWTHTFNETDGPSSSAAGTYAPLKEIDDTNHGGPIPVGLLPIATPLRLYVTGSAEATAVTAGPRQLWVLISDLVGQNFFGLGANGGIGGQFGRAHVSAGGAFAPIVLSNEPVTGGSAGDPYITFEYAGGLPFTVYIGTVYQAGVQTASIQNFTLTICEPSS